MPTKPTIEMYQGGCGWYVSAKVPQCGRNAVAVVPVRSRTVKSDVLLCVEHKAEHDRKAAEARATAQRRRKTDV